jgi:O-antigen/teichoic acid export membrane protein
MYRKSIAKNAILNTTKTVLGILFPLVTYPYVSRVLGVENIGVYNFSFSVLSYFLLIAALGVSTYGIREGTRIRDDRERMYLFVSELFSINMVSTIIAYVLLIVLMFSVPFFMPYRTPVLILSAEIFFTTIGVSWICNVYEDFLAIAVITIAFQIISLILIFVFVRSPHDLINYLFVLLVSNSGANIASFFYIRRKYCRFRLTGLIDWNKHLKPILIIFSTSVAITVYVSSDTTMLGIMTSDYQVGLYGTAVKVYTIIKNILAAVLMVLIPRFTLLFTSEDKNSVDETFSKVFNTLTLLMLPMCTGLYLLSDDIVTIISGQEFAGAAQPLRWLSLAIVFSLYAYMYTQCVLIPKKEEKVVFKATLISAIINILLNCALIPLWGINAAAITTVIAEVITFIIAYYYARESVKLIGTKKTLVSAAIGCMNIVLVCTIAKSIDNILLRICVSVAVSVIVYYSILLLMKNSLAVQLKETVLRKCVKNKH